MYSYPLTNENPTIDAPLPTTKTSTTNAPQPFTYAYPLPYSYGYPYGAPPYGLCGAPSPYGVPPSFAPTFGAPSPYGARLPTGTLVIPSNHNNATLN
jgi:hypothetical protein